MREVCDRRSLSQVQRRDRRHRGREDYGGKAPCLPQCRGGGGKGGWSWLSSALSASRNPKTLIHISVPAQGAGSMWTLTEMRLEEASRALPSCSLGSCSSHSIFECVPISLGGVFPLRFSRSDGKWKQIPGWIQSYCCRL